MSDLEELEELQRMIAVASQPDSEDLPLHGKGVVRYPEVPGETGAVRITVEGVAQNTADGAVVLDVAGTRIATDLDLWPDDMLGESVTVTGIVTPATQDQGLQEASWQRA